MNFTNAATDNKGFFKIKLKSSNKQGKDIENEITEKVISFSVSESMGEITSGQIQVYDNDFYFADNLVSGTGMAIEWGYIQPDLSYLYASKNVNTEDDIRGASTRKGIQARVLSPSGSGSSTGIITYNCSFYTNEYSDETEFEVYNLKMQTINELFKKIGVKKSIIRIDNANERFNSILQRESDYNLLKHLANKWGVLFKTWYMQGGTLSAFFVQPEFLKKAVFANVFNGVKSGSVITLDYKAGRCNVKSYNLSMHIVDNGGGQHQKVTFTNEKPVYEISDANPAPSSADSKSPDRAIAQLTAKKITTQVDTEKPGVGYNINANVIANPLWTPGMIVKFGEGFPAFLKAKNANIDFYVKRVTHTISKSGYDMSIEIGDIFNKGAIRNV